MQYLPFGSLLVLVLLIELLMFFVSEDLFVQNIVSYNSFPVFKEVENTKDIGIVLYTDYFYLFQISGLILLVAMIGSIVLTLRKRPGVKKQLINKQINYNSKEAIDKKNIKIGSGVDV